MRNQHNCSVTWTSNDGFRWIIRCVLVDKVLAGQSRTLAKLYARDGRPSIPPERLLRALLLQAFYSVRSERLLIEQLDHNLLFRWFVGLSADDPVCLLQEP